MKIYLSFFLLFTFYLPYRLAASESFLFEENKGQIKGFNGSSHPDVKFLLRIGNLKIFLLQGGIAYQFEKAHYARVSKVGFNRSMEYHDSIINIETYRMDMELVGANPNPQIITEEMSSDYIHYYNHDALNIHSYKKIIYKNIYRGIDWHIYTTKDNKIKYDFIIHPFADPSQIKLAYKNAEQILQDKNGNLIIRNRMGDIAEQKPSSFQNGKKIESCFQRSNDIVQIKIPNYNQSRLLLIDPQIEWSSYYGSSQSIAYGVKLDKKGNIVMIGRTSSTTAIANNGFQNNYGGGATDMFIVKFTENLTRLWASYYGGNGDDAGSGSGNLVIDNANNIYFCGSTSSDRNISYNGFQNSKIGTSNTAFIVKFDSSGDRKWASYFGDESTGSSLAIDKKGYIYFTGQISSINSINYSNGGYKSSYSFKDDSVDAYIVKFDSAGNRVISTYYGGMRNDLGSSLVVDDSFNTYLGGFTYSTNGIASSGIYNTYGGGTGDGFIVKFDSTLSTVKWATYFGGSNKDIVSSLTLGNDSILIFGGSTQSANRIYLNGFKNTPYTSADNGFIGRMNKNGGLTWCSYIESPGEINIDRKEKIYTCGRTGISNVAYRGLQDSFKGIFDVILNKLDMNGNRIWTSYFGGSGSDNGYGSTIDKDLNFYLCGLTNTSNLASNGYQNSLLPSTGSVNAFLVKLSCNRDTTLYDTICRGDSLVFNGIARTQSGVYLDTLETWDICDSFITMNLTVSRRDTMHLYDSICQGTTKTWNGSQVSTAGVYLDTLMNIEGCDSFLIFHLSIRALDSTRIYDTSCGNTPRTWNGMNLTTAGLYLDTLQNRYGCDSFLYYQYIPKMASSSSPIVSICKGSSYTVGLKSYASSGTYRDTLKNFQGCDSFVTLSLTVRDTSFTVWTASICQGSYYLFQGDTLRSAGVYRDTLKNKNGCDSTIQVSLSVNSLGSKTIYDTICPDKSYAFSGKLLTSSGIYRDSLNTKKGCDSIVTLHLFVRPKKPLSLIDSIYRLNATTGFSSYRWYRNSLPLSAPNLNYYFPSESGSFKVEVTEKNGCKYFSDSVQVIKAGLHSQHTSLNIEIFPNPAKDHLYIQSTTALDRELRIEIYTIDGRRLALPMQKISNLLYSISTASLSTGVYTIELKTAERTETRMFVVE